MSNSSLLPIKKPDYASHNYHRRSFSCSSNIPLKHDYSHHLRRHSRAYAQKRKVTIVLIFCLFVALLLWTPQSLSLTYETLIESYAQMSPERRIVLLIFNNFANLFLCINASIDFILYCFLSEKFARTCRQMICRSCMNRQDNSCKHSRVMSVDRTSLILTHLSPNTNHQQQIINRRITTYDAQLYNFYHHSIANDKCNQKPKRKAIRSIRTHDEVKNQVFYRTSLVNKQAQEFSTDKNNDIKKHSVAFHESISVLMHNENPCTTNTNNDS